MDKLTLKKLYNTEFVDLYEKLQKDSDLSETELEKVLSIGLFLVGLDDIILQNLGYRIFLLYSKVTKDFKPLYELSLNKGLIPISYFIEHKLEYSKQYGNIHTSINSIMFEDFKFNESYQTIEQFKLFKNATEKNTVSQIIVAPTSYGKTELILSLINHNVFKKICIISPTKSLLAQTKKRIIDKLGYKKIITYPEMYNESDDNMIAVLTQERLLRLLQNNSELKIDLLIIDEAHNILDEFKNTKMRSVILTSVISICYKRNNNIVCKYLTPFLKSKDSLDSYYLPPVKDWLCVVETVKSEMYYFYDLKNNKKILLDQYCALANKFINLDIEPVIDDSDVVIKNADYKNLIYLNSPKKIEEFAFRISNKLSDQQIYELKKAANDLREYVHEKYKLADYIEKGIIYHHGSIPEPIRYFIEDLYNNIPELNFLISNSTLLEGVNIPATRMFILDPSKGDSYLSPSSFRNLIGRVCRFKEIFNSVTGDLKYLLPEIYIVKGGYCRKDFNISSFVKGRKILVNDNDKVDDDVRNPLLINSKSNMEIKKSAEDILANISHNDVIVSENSNKANTKVGQLCFENNINIFNIFETEYRISDEIENIGKAQTIDDIFKVINHLFFSKIDANANDNIRRLTNQEAQNFYKMLINWKIEGLTTKTMINKIVNYWNSLETNAAQSVYVGKWGDKTRNGYKRYWTDITMKNEQEKINLAIVRLKEEYDFIDNELIKYIETLFSLNIIEQSLYHKVKYGTDNLDKIALLNCGISSGLSKLLQDKYPEWFEANTKEGTISFDINLVNEMEKNNENGILIAEVKINAQGQS